MVLSTVWQRVQEKMNEVAGLCGVRVATLANEDGLLLASCGQELDPEWLAAVSPLVQKVSGDDRDGVLQGARDKGFSLQVTSFSMGGQRLYLCAAGPQQSPSLEMTDFARQIAQWLR
ncbi:MAG: hypothetical protein H6728_14030 [Myxococcales bacterium]|nr:hypothetical protein [Myxococcales bacterium]MCB9644190.1 hypothetical protein [Myxococcales bacterium]